VNNCKEFRQSSAQVTFDRSEIYARDVECSIRIDLKGDFTTSWDYGSDSQISAWGWHYQ
jgi:hypothetical protein